MSKLTIRVIPLALELKTRPQSVLFIRKLDNSLRTSLIIRLKGNVYL